MSFFRFLEDGFKDKAAKFGAFGWGLKGFRASKTERRLMVGNGIAGFLNQLLSLKNGFCEAIQCNILQGILGDSCGFFPANF